jgi:hypothetical protein
MNLAQFAFDSIEFRIEPVCFENNFKLKLNKLFSNFVRIEHEQIINFEYFLKTYTSLSFFVLLILNFLLQSLHECSIIVQKV